MRRGARVVLYGPVNAGKCTLFNRLLGEARALVDEEPGTTRDVLEARVEWEGLALTLLDTAGLREQPARLEALGIARTREALCAADLAVLVLPPGVGGRRPRRGARRQGARRCSRCTGRVTRETSLTPALSQSERRAALRVSGLTGEGVELLCARVLARLWGGGAPGAVLLASERHADALRRCSEALARAEEASAVAPLEVVSGEVGLALEALGEVSGTCTSPRPCWTPSSAASASGSRPLPWAGGWMESGWRGRCRHTERER